MKIHRCVIWELDEQMRNLEKQFLGFASDTLLQITVTYTRQSINDMIYANFVIYVLCQWNAKYE